MIELMTDATPATASPPGQTGWPGSATPKRQHVAGAHEADQAAVPAAKHVRWSIPVPPPPPRHFSPPASGSSSSQAPPRARAMDAMPAHPAAKTTEKEKRAQQRVHDVRINALNLEPTLPRATAMASILKPGRQQWREEEDERRRQQRLRAEEHEQRGQCMEEDRKMARQEQERRQAQERHEADISRRAHRPDVARGYDRVQDQRDVRDFPRVQEQGRLEREEHGLTRDEERRRDDWERAQDQEQERQREMQ